jgi:hypothetical protein
MNRRQKISIKHGVFHGRNPFYSDELRSWR